MLLFANVRIFGVECFPGYMGANCSHTCRYPSYGKGCQGVCHCEQEECHAIIGCSQKAGIQFKQFKDTNCLYVNIFDIYSYCNRLSLLFAN